MLKSTRKSKNRNFYHIFIFPGDTLGAITLNVVWMERKFDAYKLSRCMCPYIYEIQRYICEKVVILLYPLAFDAPVRGVPVRISAPLWDRKTRMVSLPDDEKISKISLFVFNVIHKRDRRTD